MPVGLLAAIVVLAVAAVLWRLTARLRAAEQRVKELGFLRHDTEALRTDLERGLAVTRAHLAAVAAGDAPPRDVILRGAPYRDIDPADAFALWQRTPGLQVLDVRSAREFASGHIPNARQLPLDELEDRLAELPPRDATVLVHCAAGGRSTVACELLGQHGWTGLLNLVGGIHAWPGPRVADAPDPAPQGPLTASAVPSGTAISYRGGPVTEEQVVGAIRDCYDPEIPLNIYDLGLIYGVDIDDQGMITVDLTLTSPACPVGPMLQGMIYHKLTQMEGVEDVEVNLVWDPPWDPKTMASEEVKMALGIW